MATLKINGVDYDVDSLSDQAKAQLASLHYVANEAARIQALKAAYQAARSVYANALKAALPSTPAPSTSPEPIDYDSIKFY